MKKQSFLRDGERTRPRVQRRAPRGPHHSTLFLLIPLCILLAGASAYANPQGMTVVSGSAHTAQHGSTLQITTSQQAFLHWTSFNIAAGETTIFREPSASSIVFNNIGGANPTTIFGSLRANGIVVLENANGFYFGPNAFVKAGGLVVTTAAINPWASGGGAGWSFDGPPAATPIVNYGHLETASGGSLFLIGKQIENHGTIEAPGGTAALLAGQEVLLSERPDGLSLSVPVRLPAGSVDNQGRIVADAGQVLLQAQTVNNSGVVQANSVRQKNGVIEFYASDDIQLTGSSVIQANGGADGTSPGGNITIKSGGTFSDCAGSQITATGGANGGNGGNVEISAPNILSLDSSIDAGAKAGWNGGTFTLDPDNIELGGINGTGSSDTLYFNVNTAFRNITAGQILLEASGDITLDPGTTWDLSQSTGKATGQLTLQAGGDITLGAENNPSLITDENNWSVTLDAGYNVATGHVVSGMGNVYLYDYSYIETAAGNISVVAGNSVTIEDGGIVTGIANGAVMSGGGGNVSVQALAGNVNCGSSPAGYLFSGTGTGYAVDPYLGGISTAGGGNVTIQAGGNITAFLPQTTAGAQEDPGAGAFGAAPGNVTLTAGGDVTGHYVVANGTGTITAVNAGEAGQQLALSLIKGGWVVNAADNIVLQEVRNPNGMFNNSVTSRNSPAPTQFLFNYDPQASVVLNAGDAVTITGQSLPRISGENTSEGLIFPPVLTINAGAGGITLDTPITLYPSPEGTFVLTTTGGGNLSSGTAGYPVGINLSDSSSAQWQSANSFSTGDYNQNLLLHLDDPNPAQISISGSMSDIAITSPKAVEIYVTDNIIDCSASIRNLHSTDTSIISAGGEILDHSDYVIVTLPSGETPNFTALAQVADPYLNAFTLQPVANAYGILTIPNPNFIKALEPVDGLITYNSAAGGLAYRGVMSLAVEQALLSMKTPFLDAATIENIYTKSQVDATSTLAGYSIFGPGTLRMNAASMDLGNSSGVISQGFGNDPSLAPYTARGANIDISVSGDLTMLSSTINSEYGGNVSVNCGGTVNLGSTLVSTGYSGIISVWQGNISVIAGGDVNVDGSRIAAYDGGNIFVESLEGNVNAGSGGGATVGVSKPYLNQHGQVAYLAEVIPGSGIMATSFPQLVYGETSSQVGNITVETPQGNIVASQGGISQLALGPVAHNDATINLNAGSKGYVGNVDASGSGVVGGEVNITATGNVIGLVVASVSANVSALQNVSATVLSQGAATVSAGGMASGVVVGVGSVSVSGGAGDVMAAFAGGGVTTSGTVSGPAGPAAPASSNSGSTAATGQQLTTTLSNSEQAANDNNSTDDNDPLKKKKRLQLIDYVGRVTVLLPP
jgi:filamentous hemagglutinin family protein